MMKMVCFHFLLYLCIFIKYISIIQIFILFLDIYVISELIRIEKYHHTVKILHYSIYSLSFSSVFLLLYYACYCDSGRIYPILRLLSTLFYIIAESLMVLLFILIAKGWTITRRKLTRNVFYVIYLLGKS